MMQLDPTSARRGFVHPLSGRYAQAKILQESAEVSRSRVARFPNSQAAVTVRSNPSRASCFGTNVICDVAGTKLLSPGESKLTPFRVQVA